MRINAKREDEAQKGPRGSNANQTDYTSRSKACRQEPCRCLFEADLALLTQLYEDNYTFAPLAFPQNGEGCLRADQACYRRVSTPLPQKPVEN